MRIFLSFLLFCLPYCCFSQFLDDFSNIEAFKKNNWAGNLSHFQINSNKMLQLSNQGATTTSYVSAPFQCRAPYYWEATVILNFNPSQYNYCRLYLYANSSNLKETTTSYYLLLGGSDDAVALFEQQGDQHKCLSREKGLLNKSYNQFTLRANCKEGEWKLYYRNWDETQFQLVGSSPSDSNESQLSGFLGIYCTYTSSNSQKFFFDYLQLSSSPSEPTDNPDAPTDPDEPTDPDLPQKPDTISLPDEPLLIDSKDSLKVDSVSISSAERIRLYFNKNIRIDKAYFLFGNEQYIMRAHPTTRAHIVQGEISPALTSGEKQLLFYHGIYNLNNEIQPFGVVPFTYNQDATSPDPDPPAQPDGPTDPEGPDDPIDTDPSKKPTHFGDILITEIMANPKGLTLLPEVEYIELLNRTPNELSLKDCRFHYASKVYLIDDYILKANSRAVLCHVDKAAYFSVSTIPVKSFPALANTGKLIYLENAEGKLLSWVDYTDKWYGDAQKKNGGFSLEMIDEDNLYSSSKNWSACCDIRGGTPGIINSIHRENPDSAVFYLQAHALTDANQIKLSFSKPVWPKDTLTNSWFVNQNIKELRCLNYPYGTQFLLTPTSLDSLFELDSLYDISHKPLLSHASLQFDTIIPPQKGEICINELMFRPLHEGAQFIELYNHSGHTIDLSQLTIRIFQSDTILIARYPLSNESSYWENETYAVVVPSPEILIRDYGYDGEPQIIVLDELRQFNPFAGKFALWVNDTLKIETASYLETRHTSPGDHQGVSFERRDCGSDSSIAANWCSGNEMTGYATPGYANYADAQIKWDDTLKVSSHDSAFRLATRRLRLVPDTPESDLILQYSLSESGMHANIELFDSSGHSIRKLAVDQLLEQGGELNLSTTWKTPRVRFPGIYILWIDYFSEQGLHKTQRIVIPVTP